jgi:hypothetical protein
MQSVSDCLTAVYDVRVPLRVRVRVLRRRWLTAATKGTALRHAFAYSVDCITRKAADKVCFNKAGWCTRVDVTVCTLHVFVGCIFARLQYKSASHHMSCPNKAKVRIGPGPCHALEHKHRRSSAWRGPHAA